MNNQYKKVVINFDNDLSITFSFNNEIPDKDCISLLVSNINTLTYGNINTIKIERGHTL